MLSSNAFIVGKFKILKGEPFNPIPDDKILERS